MVKYVVGDQLCVKIINFFIKKIFSIIIMVYRGFPSLTPTYGLGSSARTGTAILISSPRTKLGSQGRIYAWMKQKGQGQQYIYFLKNAIGPIPNVNPWTAI